MVLIRSLSDREDRWWPSGGPVRRRWRLSARQRSFIRPAARLYPPGSEALPLIIGTIQAARTAGGPVRRRAAGGHSSSSLTANEGEEETSDIYVYVHVFLCMYIEEEDLRGGARVYTYHGPHRGRLDRTAEPSRRPWPPRTATAGRRQACC
jgi:hypothetical protein